MWPLTFEVKPHLIKKLWFDNVSINAIVLMLNKIRFSSKKISKYKWYIRSNLILWKICIFEQKSDLMWP